MSKHKIIFTVLALVLVMALSFTSCQKAKVVTTTPSTVPSSAPSSAVATTADPNQKAGLAPAKNTDPVTFSMFSRDTGRAPASTNKISQKIKELTGVSLTYEYLVGQLSQKVGVMIAGGDYPDFVYLGGDAPQMLNAGAGVDLTEYIKNAPNLNAHFNEHNPIWSRRNIFNDGKTYVLECSGTSYGPPSQTEYTAIAFWLQKAVLSDAGYPPVPTNLDDYFALIKGYYEKNPQIDGVDTIPYDFSMARPYGHAPEMLAGYPQDGFNMMWDQKDTTKTEGIADYSDYNKQFLQKMNGFFRQGLIAEDSFSITPDQYFARISSGAELATYIAGWYISTPINSLKSQGKYERTFIPCPLVFSPDRQENYYDPRDMTGNNGIFISKSCKDPQRLVDFFDYILQEDVQKLLSWGIEGEDYLVDADGKFYRDKTMDTNWRNPDWVRDNTGSVIKQYAPKIEGIYSDGNCATWTDQPIVFKGTLSDYDKKFLEAYKAENFLSGFLNTKDVVRSPYYPSWGTIILPPDSDVLVVNQKIVELGKEYVPQLVMAPSDDAFNTLWQKYWDAMTAANPQMLLDHLSKSVADINKKLLGQ